jgi:hypothetical protein
MACFVAAVVAAVQQCGCVVSQLAALPADAHAVAVCTVAGTQAAAAAPVAAAASLVAAAASVSAAAVAAIAAAAAAGQQLLLQLLRVSVLLQGGCWLQMAAETSLVSHKQ